MNTWINGRPADSIDVRDRGLHYGDGLFETMRVQRHGIRLLDFHLERLAHGCRRLAIAAPDPLRLRRELLPIAARRADAVLKLIVTRGPGARGYRPSGRERSTRIMGLYPLTSRAARVGVEPVRVRLCATRLCGGSALAGLKTLNRLDSVLARAEWADERIWEGLMRDSDDNIVCGTMSNVFVRRGSLLLTPDLGHCGIAGVMRRWVMGQCASLGLEVRETRLGWRDMTRVQEAFLTNAVAGVVPVAVFMSGHERVRLAEHDVARTLRAQLECL